MGACRGAAGRRWGGANCCDMRLLRWAEKCWGCKDLRGRRGATAAWFLEMRERLRVPLLGVLGGSDLQRFGANSWGVGRLKVRIKVKGAGGAGGGAGQHSERRLGCCGRAGVGAGCGFALEEVRERCCNAAARVTGSQEALPTSPATLGAFFGFTALAPTESLRPQDLGRCARTLLVAAQHSDTKGIQTCGQSPMDFESISSATWTQCLASWRKTGHSNTWK